MKISVIIPTYKPKSYIWECLDSLCSQSFPKGDFEVVIVLNGCNEPYETEIKEYMALHPEVHWQYRQTDKPGVSNARNIAFETASGQYVAFIDDDDFVSPSYLEDLYCSADESTISVAYPYAFSDPNVGVQLKYSITDSYEEYSIGERVPATKVRRLFSGPCMKLIPSSYMKGRLFDESFANGEDSIYMFLISDRMKYVSCAPKSAIYYRRYRENSAVTSNKTVFDVICNSLRMCLAYTRIYFRHPFDYSFRRYMLVMLGACHTVIERICG